MHEGIDARGLVGAHGLDQGLGKRCRFGAIGRIEPRLGEALGNDRAFVGTIGATNR
jgi:hypothetical protein